MSEERWSTGPWHTYINGAGRLVIADARDIDLFDIGDIGEIDQIDHWNARLVTAAPQLYALVRILTDQHLSVAAVRKRANVLRAQIDRDIGEE